MIIRFYLGGGGAMHSTQRGPYNENILRSTSLKIAFFTVFILEALEEALEAFSIIKSLCN